MVLLLGLVLAASPPPCDSLWPVVWKAYEAQELSKGTPPLFERLPDAKERLGRAWRVECGAFDQPALDCATGVTLEAELAVLRKSLEKEKMPAKEIDRLIARARAEWSVLECREVDRALDRAGAAVAREVFDAGVPRSDECMGAELESGRCQCAHSRCMDLCCPAGWACAHSGAKQSKCIRPPK
ncbi:MAG: hypothetical protein Q8N23_04110 [Archangium sp.]|nr:hypothetical protein [Archangium sp.]MDP3569870.1 hypothetical protein [Archangium sp.]